MRLPRDPTDVGLVVLFVATEVATLLDPPDGSRVALLAFPAAWILPLLLRRRFPTAAPLTAMAALAVEGQVAYAGTETQWVLPAVILAFYTLGRRLESSRAILAGLLGFALGLFLMSADTGPITAAGVGFLAIITATPFAAGVAMRARSREAEEMARRAEEHEARARAAVAEERARIARELHDMIGHAISVITVQAGAARMQLDRDPEAARAPLVAIEDTGLQTLAEMRRLIGMLRDMGEPGLAPQPGLEQLDRLVGSVRDSGLHVELRRRGEPPPALAPEIDLAAYRIVQEALTNALKHGADGATVLVTVGFGERSVTLEIESSGADGRNGGGGGRGLVGMRERVELCGGELEVGSAPGGGYSVRASLPLAATR
jgi:signal transduction histidine kinase